MKTATVLFLAISVIWGCGDSKDDLVLARVGDTEITVAQLQEFESRLPESLRTRRAGVEGYMDYLQTMIDKELLLQEARKRGLDERPEFRRKLGKEKDKRVLSAFLRREVIDKIEFTDQELEEYQRETGRDRAVLVNRIVVNARDEAEAIKRQLENGADFSRLAAEKSVIGSLLMQGYLLKDDLYPPILQEMVFPLQKGELSEIVNYNNQYGIYTIVDDTEIDIAQVRSLLEAQLMQKKLPLMIEELTTRLQKELDFRPHQDALESLVELLGRGTGEIAQDERATILYEYRDGAYTVGDFADLAQDLYMGFASDTREKVGQFLRRIFLPRAVLLAGARDAGIYEDGEIVEWSQGREQADLLMAIRSEATSDVFVDENEARQYYDENPKIFTPLETVTLEEILVRSEEEAVRLLERIEQGEEMATLADEYTLRRRGKGHKGKFHVHPFEKDRYTELFKAVQGAGVGQLVGPVEVTVPATEVLETEPTWSGDRYYSIFKVIESTIGAGPEPFSKVEKRARALMRLSKQEQDFQQFILDLRFRYEPQIQINGDNVEKLVRARSA